MVDEKFEVKKANAQGLLLLGSDSVRPHRHFAQQTNTRRRGYERLVLSLVLVSGAFARDRERTHRIYRIYKLESGCAFGLSARHRPLLQLWPDSYIGSQIDIDCFCDFGLIATSTPACLHNTIDADMSSSRYRIKYSGDDGFVLSPTNSPDGKIETSVSGAEGAELETNNRVASRLLALPGGKSSNSCTFIGSPVANQIFVQLCNCIYNIIIDDYASQLTEPIFPVHRRHSHRRHNRSQDCQNAARSFLGLTQTCRQLREEFLLLHRGAFDVTVDLCDIRQYFNDHVTAGVSDPRNARAKIIINMISNDGEPCTVNMRDILLLISKAPGITLHVRVKEVEPINLKMEEGSPRHRFISKHVLEVVYAVRPTYLWYSWLPFVDEEVGHYVSVEFADKLVAKYGLKGRRKYRKALDLWCKEVAKSMDIEADHSDHSYVNWVGRRTMTG